MIKLLEENTGIKLLNMGLGDLSLFFFGYDTKSTSNESKNKWQDDIKLWSFCPAKETTNKMKIQNTEWKKYANGIPDYILISKIYKELI